VHGKIFHGKPIQAVFLWKPDKNSVEALRLFLQMLCAA